MHLVSLLPGIGHLLEDLCCVHRALPFIILRLMPVFMSMSEFAACYFLHASVSRILSFCSCKVPRQF